MNKNSALLIAGIVFGFVSLMHLLRAVFTVSITIGSYIIPIWVSWVGFIVAFILSVIMFTARRNS